MFGHGMEDIAWPPHWACVEIVTLSADDYQYTRSEAARIQGRRWQGAVCLCAALPALRNSRTGCSPFVQPQPTAGQRIWNLRLAQRQR